eukprot:CAMPEP_0174270654 /NCGR_PEP_ID=MMETSP0439-20130205/45218_1 /TAXON_ID=0 /ORGANISM="Stereomyxa ramosa, Strain Chinc5" /LENGTH=430 /DNA_ID=CAMNT_0015360117 /DNA_START=37 /DNA_END=1329 /DNA_ORIENTATION=+
MMEVSSPSCHFFSLFDDDEEVREMPERLRKRFPSSWKTKRKLQEEEDTEESYEVPWTELPDEILLNIFSYLAVWDLVHIQLACKTWGQLAGDRYLGTELHFGKFSGNLSDDSLLKLLSNSPNLRSLNLSGCRGLTVKSISRIDSLATSLSSLNLTACKLTDESAFSLVTGGGERIPNRHEETLKKIAWEGMGWVCRYCETQHAGASHNGFLKKCFTCSAPCVSSYFGERMEGISATNLGKNLRILKLAWCSNISDLVVAYLVEECNQLEEINLDNCTRLTDTSCYAIAENCSESIQSIHLLGCFRITSVGIGKMLFMAQNVSVLSAPPSLSNLAIDVDNFPVHDNLQQLQLSPGSAVTGATLGVAIPTKFPKLRKLDLSSVQIGPDTNLKIAVKSLPLLSTLILSSFIDTDRRILTSQLRSSKPDLKFSK